MKALKFIFVIFIFNSCESFLEIKPNQKLAIPNKTKDLQALMDDPNMFNSWDVAAGEVSADDYFLTESTWKGLSDESIRRMYVWEKNDIFLASSNDWFRSYRLIYYANVVLDNLEDIIPDKANQDEWNNIKGQALFIRARQFFQNVLVWSNIYNESTANRDLGIPLRLSQNFNLVSVRPSVSDVYEQIIDDLKQATLYLPETPLVKTRGSLLAAYGMLGRVYLAMGQYDSCHYYTDLALRAGGELLDYRTEIDVSSTKPFLQFNKEVLFDSYITNSALYERNAMVDTVLYDMYVEGDIRKKAFFTQTANGNHSFKGYYSLGLFGGVATDELYLMRAECNIRLGRVEDALLDLNTLLEKRFLAEAFNPVEVRDVKILLDIILKERRKELLLRGIRWMDIKRLNRDGANIKLKRVIGDKVYELSPESPRFNLSIPEDVIIKSGIPQNP